MNSQELAAAMAKFQNEGGKVKQCADGDQAVRLSPRNLWECQCGCNGDFTEHSMRAGESGRCSSGIVK